MSATGHVASAPKRRGWKDYLFYLVVGIFGLSTLGSIARIADPDGAARRDQLAAQRAQKSAERAAAGPSRSDYNVIAVVSACDGITKKAVKNPSSLSLAWSWKEVPTERGVTILRNFTAMNGFGANLDSFYVCSYDAISQDFVGYDVREGNY